MYELAAAVHIRRYRNYTGEIDDESSIIIAILIHQANLQWVERLQRNCGTKLQLHQTVEK